MKQLPLTRLVALTTLLLVSSLHASVVYYPLPTGLQNPTGLVEGPDKNIYGTAVSGGTFAAGAIFKMTPTGQFTVLASFDGTNGWLPAGLTLANGDFYGVTSGGGANGLGTVFKATLAGSLTALYSFDHSDLGWYPTCPLALGSDGKLYGSTPNSGNPGGYGSIFTSTLDGTVSSVTSPGGATVLVQYPGGDMYGVKYNGEIFHLLSDGTYTAIANASWSPGGQGFLVGQDGNFYGCALAGGANGTGCIYKVTPAGVLTILASLDADNGPFLPNATGIQPRSLIQANDGNFYGTTTYGAANGWGGVFQMTTNGEIHRVFDFSYTNGTAPLLQGSDGNIYGATSGMLPVTSSPTRAATRIGYVFSLRSHAFATGKYNGLFAETNSSGDAVVNVASAGMIKTMNVNNVGVFSGKLMLAGGSYNLAGKFDTNGNAAPVTVPIAAGSVIVTMTLDSVSGVITGSVAESTGKWTAALRANRGMTKFPSARYTMLIPSADTTGATSPPGAGYETINNANGSVSFSGAVADGTTANCGPEQIAINGDAPLYASLYKGQGVLWGWMNLSSKPSGMVSWVKNANATTNNYTAGFTNRDLLVSIERWVKPATGAIAIPVTGATLTVAGGTFGTLTYTVNGVAANGNCLQTTASNTTNIMQASIVPASGALTVKIKSGTKVTTARGAFLQNSKTAGGAFVQPGQAGSFTLTP